MPGQRQDDVDAAADTASGQIAHFDDAVAIDRMSGQAGNHRFDGGVEIALEKQLVVGRAAPTGRCDDPVVSAQHHQIWRKSGDVGVVVLLVGAANEPLDFLTLG